MGLGWGYGKQKEWHLVLSEYELVGFSFLEKGGPRVNVEVGNCCWRNCRRCGILFSVAGYGRAEGQTGSLGQLVFDVLCRFCSGGLGLVVTDEDGLAGVSLQ